MASFSQLSAVLMSPLKTFTSIMSLLRERILWSRSVPVVPILIPKASKHLWLSGTEFSKICLKSMDPLLLRRLLHKMACLYFRMGQLSSRFIISQSPMLSSQVLNDRLISLLNSHRLESYLFRTKYKPILKQLESLANDRFELYHFKIHKKCEFPSYDSRYLQYCQCLSWRTYNKRCYNYSACLQNQFRT